jgi:predicted permease
VVIGETAAAVVLALFAGLTLRSFDRLSSVDIGFDPSRLIAFRVDFSRSGSTPESAAALSREFLERLRALPGVVSAGRTSVRPLHQGGTATTVTPVGEGDTDRSEFPIADVRFVDAEYFGTLGLAPLSGRLFSLSERAGGPQRVVVNEMLGKKLWPGEERVVGRSFDLSINGGSSPEIIGVVRDVRLLTPRSDPRPTVYVFTEQSTAGEQFDVLLRTAGDAAAVLPELRRVLHSVASGTPIFRVERMDATLGAGIARERATAQLLAFFGIAALLLVVVGVYGLYAGEVARRRREIGVRMALGETSARVVRAMLTQALARTGLGVLVGVAIGFVASKVLTTVLYGVAPTDPVSYVAAATAVILAAAGATLIPAMQASGVEPGAALRAE